MGMAEHKRALAWIRRDLRLKDHRVFQRASEIAEDFVPVFIFDSKILGLLQSDDRRVTFIFDAIEELKLKFEKLGSALVVRFGDPVLLIPELAKETGADVVVCAQDFERSAVSRDKEVYEALKLQGCRFETGADHVVFPGKSILNKEGQPYRVYTPYSNAWMKLLEEQPDAIAEAKWDSKCLVARSAFEHLLKNVPTLDGMGFDRQSLWLQSGEDAAAAKLAQFLPKMTDYKDKRDFFAVDGTSGLSVHLRFGTISIRECVRKARAQSGVGAFTWLKELIWRDFYSMLLDRFPHVEKGCFKPECDQIQWPGTELHFQAWCDGQTGYPVIDAAMRHFNQTGFMHNRLRMIVAMFLTKTLLVDWRKGEKYFAQHLLDFDLSSNNGGWQWSASTGCDAQPYFRVFNPTSQAEKFDPDETFIRSQIPELGTSRYPAPIVDHSVQRLKAIALFQALRPSK
jgi:deoxyribodipyrimidine photo-lyase